MHNRNKVFISGIIGNILDHYDVALYGFLAPFLAPVFFPQQDPVVQLILAYGLMSLNLFTRFIGSIYFGKYAMKYGPQKTLIITLLGVTVCTLAMGLVPGYNELGFVAPILLCITRMTQGIFAAGEYAISSMYFIEIFQYKKRGQINGYYLASSMIGVTLASFAATIVSNSSEPNLYWRFAFYSSFVTGIAGYILRQSLAHLPYTQIAKATISSKQAIKNNKGKILTIIFVTSCSYLTYSIPFIFLNKFVPSISDITETQMLTQNTLLLVYDVVLLLIIGHFINKVNLKKLMIFLSILLSITFFSIFIRMEDLSFIAISIFRFWIVTIGALLAVTLNSWVVSILNNQDKYLIKGVSYVLGTELFGKNSTAICWTLWYYFGSTAIIGIYLSTISIIAIISLLLYKD